nr:MAG TPA: hypothetical protein [Bacteriophage sp.]
MIKIRINRKRKTGVVSMLDGFLSRGRRHRMKMS